MDPLKLAIVGVGRIGAFHALHAAELAAETGACELTALVDTAPERAQRTAAELAAITRAEIAVFSSVEDLAASGRCAAAFIATPTASHRHDASVLVESSYRVLLEKPLTGSAAEDRVFAAHLDARYPEAIMLAFQRRFDEPLRHAKKLLDHGAIGRVFKIVSILEDSRPKPNGYVSGGILPDMSVHNVDEVLWLSGSVPAAAFSIGSCVYGHSLTDPREDFDDASLHLWFPSLIAQIQVSRNHVSGYRNETWIFGEQGRIHVGRFQLPTRHVTVEAWSRDASIDQANYVMRDYGRTVPEFLDRFGPAYKAELATFVDCCRNGRPFPVTHADGLRAMEVISAGARTVLTQESATPTALRR
jgi:myo-inositol 2-dehydrogenase/D-chiro-inositol 1-dehydrogenase